MGFTLRISRPEFAGPWQLWPAFRHPSARVELIGIEENTILRIAGQFSAAEREALRGSIEGQIYGLAPDPTRSEGLSARTAPDFIGIGTLTATASAGKGGD